MSLLLPSSVPATSRAVVCRHRLFCASPSGARVVQWPLVPRVNSSPISARTTGEAVPRRGRRCAAPMIDHTIGKGWPLTWSTRGSARLNCRAAHGPSRAPMKPRATDTTSPRLRRQRQPAHRAGPGASRNRALRGHSTHRSRRDSGRRGQALLRPMTGSTTSACLACLTCHRDTPSS